jgi:LmbE family N-acetylglucosaminyl deacetylase
MVHLAFALTMLVQRLQPTPPGPGAGELGSIISGLGVSARVLMIGAHPDDEDTRFLTFLARGRHVRTAYLSLTRGDGGQNLIGNELGEALGVIRTEELLAARRIDGAEQFFTRAYDFGFSKTADETFRHWPRDSILGDMVKVVREFRPQVIVAVFSGTPRDGHGHHQASGILAREVWDAALDTVRFPTSAFGQPWSTHKFYQGSYFVQAGEGIRYDVGEYDPLLGYSYAELAALSRSQHKSQAFGQLLRKGPSLLYVRRERSRIEGLPAPAAERSIFDGIDTTYASLAAGCSPADRPRFDSLLTIVAQVRRDASLFDPSTIVEPLGRAYRLSASAMCGREQRVRECRAGCEARDPGASVALSDIQRRIREAWVLASGIAVEATAPRDVVALGDTMSVTVTTYNRGTRPLVVYLPMPEGEPRRVELPPDSVRSHTYTLSTLASDRELAVGPEWLAQPRRGDLFSAATQPSAYPAGVGALWETVDIGGTMARVDATIVQRIADPVKGEIDRPLAVAPAISILLDRQADYARANTQLVRQLRVELRSAATSERTVRVTLRLPTGLTVDSATKTATLPGFGAIRSVTFTLRGQLPVGRHEIVATAESNGQTFARGYTPIEYDHIRPQQIYRPSTMAIEAVDVKLPPDATIAYIQGVGDNSPAVLQQLGLKVSLLDPAAIPQTDLSRYSAIVVGTRAYESNDALVANNAALLDYVKRGGTMVVQYGQYEMVDRGLMPYPITLGRPADRVTDEASPIAIVDPKARVLTYPNAITPRDFEGWIQDRTLYMPRTHDPAYKGLLTTNDPGEPANDGAVLVAKYGAGTYVYTTLAFFRQLPNGVPGAARLFVNLLAAQAPSPPKAQ